MQRTIVTALFSKRNEAEDAFHDLRQAGFELDRIGIVTRYGGETNAVPELQASHAEQGAATGVVAGGLVGSVVGWAAATGLLMVPGIGPVLAAGTLATVVGGAAAGAAAGGLVGGLIGMGIPEAEARHLEQALQQGSVLLTVEAGERGAEAVDILTRHGGTEVRSRTAVEGTPPAPPL